jgi:hypothetical protein
MINTIAKLILSTPPDLGRKYILGIIAVIITLLSTSLYYINVQSASLAKSISQARSMAAKTDSLISEYNAVTQEEDNLADTLSKKKDFAGLKSYFERFCQTNKITPEPGWSETAEVKEISGSDRFQEETLLAQIKNIKMKELVQYIDAIEKDDLISLKDLSVEKNDKKLSLKMTISTKRFKRTVEE